VRGTTQQAAYGAAPRPIHSSLPMRLSRRRSIRRLLPAAAACRSVTQQRHFYGINARKIERSRAPLSWAGVPYAQSYRALGIQTTEQSSAIFWAYFTGPAS